MKRNAFDAVRAEPGQLADILFELCGGPCVVGVGLRAVAELMAADGIRRRGRQVERPVDAQPAFRPIDAAEQLAGGE